MTTSPKPAPSTPTSKRGGNNTHPRSTGPNPATTAALALNMVWQLLVVIVLPLLGGHALDTRLDTSPIWMGVGMVVALGGMIAVVVQTLRQLNQLNGTADTDIDKENQQ